MEVLKGIDLNVDAGELVSIVGSSGCGKSTLMNILGFLDTPSTGTYLFNGKESSGLNDEQLSDIRGCHIGFCFQQFNLLPRLNALENVCLPLVYRGVQKAERIDRARKILARVEMADREKHRPMELSGGQQQRVAIARALVGDPGLLLADEPTGALDTHVSDSIMGLFRELNKERGITTVIVTHDPDLAGQCNRQIHIQDGLVMEDHT